MDNENVQRGIQYYRNPRSSELPVTQSSAVIRYDSYRVSRDPPERDFYIVLSYDENKQVVAREALLVQHLNHR